jgi:hypothetical protein
MHRPLMRVTANRHDVKVAAEERLALKTVYQMNITVLVPSNAPVTCLNALKHAYAITEKSIDRQGAFQADRAFLQLSSGYSLS